MNYKLIDVTEEVYINMQESTWNENGTCKILLSVIFITIRSR